MAPLHQDLRKQLEKVIVEAREVSEEGAHAALQQLAVDQAEPFKNMPPERRELRIKLRARGRQLGDTLEEKKKTQSIQHLTQECSYHYWHRMLFARFLAENHLLIHPDLAVPVTLEECEELAKDEKPVPGGKMDKWVLAGRFAATMLPQIFRPDDPVLQVTFAPEHQLALEKLLESLPNAVFTADDSLGWVYQFWQSKRKGEVNASEKKIGADELPAVTQLFTEHYMVDFLLDNTLGAWWAGKVFTANPKLAETAKSEEELRKAVALPGVPWSYLRFIKGEDGEWRPAAEKLAERAAVEAVIRDNLFGLEIDPRCTQIGAFNLALAAWRRVGYCPLKKEDMHLACSGLGVAAKKEEWLELAKKSEKLQAGMERLYELFQKAPVLGSLINPRAVGGDLFVAAFHELQPLLGEALKYETTDDAHELAVTAKGIAEAAEILAGQFTLVATNVPYLKGGKQDDILKDFSERFYSDAKTDLATCFVERCLKFCTLGGCVSLVTPQSWLFMGTYRRLRIKLLKESLWCSIARLGPHAFETIGGEVVNVALVTLRCGEPSEEQCFSGLDVGEEATPVQKSARLRNGPPALFGQSTQLENPDARIAVDSGEVGSLLSEFASSYVGMHMGDNESFVRCIWEIPKFFDEHQPYQSPVDATFHFGGRHWIALWFEGGRIHVENPKARVQGQPAWGKSGISVRLMGHLPATIASGEVFEQSVANIVPHSPGNLSAIWAFCSSEGFNKAVRRLDQALKVTSGTLVKVPFDLAHWQRVAAEKYPHGLPKPFSSDPTQWLFNGHPKGSDNPLQVAVARLLDYRWPRQTGSSFPDCPLLGPDGLEPHADGDGIVCLPALLGEQTAADRLRELLATAYGKQWSPVKESELLTSADYGRESLEEWLRDGFFIQHCALFHQRPFIWHIWDGRKDGFSALVNYHRLNRKLLEKLIYAYLGDWIKNQKADVAKDKAGAEARLIAAQELEENLKLIVEGEPPYDIFVRWKPIEQQPIGWEPDLNDGVRMNIRPFVEGGVLRKTPNIKWGKDRGKDPESAPWYKVFKGDRISDHHLTLGVKQDAREKARNK
jgi:hypothetical protein